MSHGGILIWRAERVSRAAAGWACSWRLLLQSLSRLQLLCSARRVATGSTNRTNRTGSTGSTGRTLPHGIVKVKVVVHDVERRGTKQC